MKEKIRLAVFDLAGTVADYGSCAPAGAFARLFEIHGIDVTLKQAREPMGLHKRDHIKAMLDMPEIAAQWQTVKGAEYTAADLESLFMQFIPLQLECLPDFCDIIPGAAEAAETLRSMGLMLAATTGYNREMMDIVLSALRKQGLEFDATCCAAEVPAGRPAPWMIYRCMEMTGVYPPSGVINFGDTLADVSSGKNAGVFSVGLAKSGNMLGMTEKEVNAVEPDTLEEMLKVSAERMLQSGADAVFDDVTAAPEAVKLAEAENELFQTKF